MKKLVDISLLIVLALFASCGKESSCFKGTGDIIVEDRAITEEITSVELSDNIDLVITQNSKASLRIQGGENILPYINSEVSGNSLSLSSDNKCGFFRDYNKRPTAYLSIPNLSELVIEGQGNVSCTNTLNYDAVELNAFNATGSVNLTLNSNRLAIKQHTGPADINIAGSSNELYVYTGGNGWIILHELDANNVHVNHDGTGDVAVKANSTLLIELTSIGNINYYGSPVVTISKHTGKGEIRKK